MTTTTTETTTPETTTPETTDWVSRAQTLAADFATRAAEHDRDRSFPFENFDQLWDAGLLNLTVPLEYGGEGAGLTDVARVVAEIGAGDSSTALVLGMQYLKHAAIARERVWPEAVHRLICEASVGGIALINAIRVEPELGTVSRGGTFATKATRTTDGWRLNGRKIYSTGSPILRFFDVGATTDEPEPRVGAFLVPAGTPGLRIERTWDHLGLRASGSDDVVLENVEIPAEYAVDLEPLDRRRPVSPVQGAWGASILSAVYLGIGRAARDWLVGYLHERVPSNLGAPLATLPRFHTAVGEIQSLLFAAERLLWDLTTSIDAGRPPASRSASALTKLHVTNNIIRATEIGMGLIGNPGLSRNNPMERLYRDALCGRVHWPQDDATLTMAGREALDAAVPRLKA
ncbi:MAG: acyl-CoA/acyl-ACP dehydrogenase [Chloroflexi bacterium]|nr:acyl-CoA/acyl-ACP dehydrogenase [Chloroflexota bacterium]